MNIFTRLLYIPVSLWNSRTKWIKCTFSKSNINQFELQFIPPSTCLLFHSGHLRKKSWEVWGDIGEEKTWEFSVPAVWAHLHFCSTFLACPAWYTDNIIHIFLLTEDTTSTSIFSSRMFEFPTVDPLTRHDSRGWDVHVSAEYINGVLYSYDIA